MNFISEQTKWYKQKAIQIKGVAAQLHIERLRICAIWQMSMAARKGLDHLFDKSIKQNDDNLHRVSNEIKQITSQI